MSLTPEMLKFEETHASESRKPEQWASDVCGLSLAFAAVILRIVTRKRARISLGIDDWLIILAVVRIATYLTCQNVILIRIEVSSPWVFHTLYHQCSKWRGVAIRE